MKLLRLLITPLTLAVLALFSLNAQATTVVTLGTPSADTDIGCQNNPLAADPNCWTAGTRGGNARHYQTADDGTSTILSAYQDGLFDADGNQTQAGVPGFADLTELYKAESADPLSGDPFMEQGLLKDSYSTEFLFDSEDKYTGATISYDGDPAPAIDCSADCFLLVKDGNADPTAYLFDIAMLWDGEMDLILKDFWGTDGAGSANGSISHISIYGRISPIPVPAAFWLFGTALVGFIGLSRSTRV